MKITSVYQRHPLGQCWYNSDIKNIYLPIPKNASTYFENSFEKTARHKIVFYQEHNFEYNQLVVILRDPIKRWTSGIATYLRNNLSDKVTENTDEQLLNILQKNKFLIETITNKIIFDEHTETQFYFLQPFLLSKAYYFYLDNNIQDKIFNFYQRQNIILNFDKRHLNRGNKNCIALFFQEYVKQNKNFYKNLCKLYESDYKLIDSVNFV